MMPPWRAPAGLNVHGDGAVYQRVRYDALVFAPTLQEIVEGTVVEILKFGAFVRFGPLDGLLHISQVMDDRVDVDEEGQRLIGKDTKRDLRIGDKVRTRIVAVSLNERAPRESKIGLTMRQPALGRSPAIWLVDCRTKSQEDPELGDALQRIGSVVMRVTNPAGTIMPDAWRVASEAFKSKERVRVEVRGEEDLLALVCIALAPLSAAVLYGLPSQGVVVVRADEAAKARVLDVLRRMDR